MKTRLAHKSKSLQVAAAVAFFAGGAVGHAQAPADQIVPFAADVKSLQVVLQPSGLPATLKFANSGSNVIYFPAVGIQNIEVRNGAGQYVPFTDAQGRLQIPIGVQSTILSVTLRDFLQDWELQNEILDNLETNSYVRQFAPIPVLAPAAVQPGRVARLIFSDPAANNARRILGESLITERLCELKARQVQPTVAHRVGLHLVVHAGRHADLSAPLFQSDDSLRLPVWAPGGLWR